MKYIDEVRKASSKAREYALEGVEQILSGRSDDVHSISPSTGATALAILALLLLGEQFERQVQSGTQWLKQNSRNNGWGKFPGDNQDPEITRLIQTVLIGSQPGVWNKLFLLSQAEELSKMVLDIGEQAVPGLEGPEPDQIHLPKVLEEKVLQKLPFYGRPVVVAASLLAAKDMKQNGVRQAVQYLRETQMDDGSWSEDIVTTSLAIIALIRARSAGAWVMRAGRWLISRQYVDGSWAAFDQLYIWAVGRAISVLKKLPLNVKESDLLNRAARWLEAGRNSDGSYGTTPPFTHPDLDDTAIALMGLQCFPEIDSKPTAELLLRLQNENGSWGTFPTFEGIPPHIQSTFPVYIPSPDVTVHVLAALQDYPGKGRETAIYRGVKWLLEQQLPTGKFPGVWFEGEIYGTAQALEFLTDLKFDSGQQELRYQLRHARRQAFEFLLAQQNADGSWGSSLIETALVFPGLINSRGNIPQESLIKGVKKILEWQLPDGSFVPCHQGIYAKGWNYEEPITSALTALRALEKYRLLPD